MEPASYSPRRSTTRCSPRPPPRSAACAGAWSWRRPASASAASTSPGPSWPCPSPRLVARRTSTSCSTWPRISECRCADRPRIRMGRDQGRAREGGSMTTRTITFDDEQWQVVPKKMAPVMWHAATAAHDAIGAWVAALANAPEPPAQQPMSRDREIWRAALTLANNICVQESDRYNGDDATQEALATGYCAQRIRDWIAPTDEQFAELLEEAGIGKGESNEG